MAAWPSSISPTITSTTAGENLGFDAHGIGDVNDDGLPDLVLTAASWNGSVGRVFVVAGIEHAVPCSADWNEDGLVQTDDFVAYLNEYGVVTAGGDFAFASPDLGLPCGELNTADFLAFLNAFAGGCP